MEKHKKTSYNSQLFNMAEFKKDVSTYCWLVKLAICISTILCSISTYGSVSVLVYIWMEDFEIPFEVVAWIPTVLGASTFLPGKARLTIKFNYIKLSKDNIFNTTTQPML